MTTQVNCPYCGGNKFALVDGWFQFMTDARKGMGNVWRPHFNVRTCLHCGHVAIFAHTAPQDFLKDVNYQHIGPA